MRILSITNNTTTFLHKPAFQARVPKNLVEQMKSKTESLTNFGINTKAELLFPASAAVAAKVYSNTSGNEITENDSVQITQKHDNMGESVQNTAASGALTLDESIKLLKTNGIDNSLAEFLSARMKKNDATSHVCPQLYKQLIVPECKYLDVETSDAYFVHIPISVAARLFNTDPQNPQISALDVNYSNDEVTDLELNYLLKSALEDEVDDSITAIKRNIYDDDKLISATRDLVPEPDNLMVLTEDLDDLQVLKLYTQKNSAFGNTLMHNIIKKDGEFEWLEKHFELMESIFDSDEIAKVLLQSNEQGEIPAVLNDKAARLTLKYFGESNPELIVNAFTTQDNLGNTFLHNKFNDDVVDELFDVLECKPELLARILSTENNNNQTAYKSLIEHSGENDEHAKVLKNKIIELATDSDLSVKKSIALLKSNDLDPQIQDYLKLQLRK